MKNSESGTRQGPPRIAKVIASSRINSYKINCRIFSYIEAAASAAAGVAAAPGANEDDGMEFEGPQQQAPPGLGNQYIISIVDF
jgi:hypothetical protein